MKVLLPLFLACCMSTLIRANILTVSNNTTYPGQYNSIQTAVDAATAGDTIYIYPSGSPYGETVNINKRLVLIGSGANPQRPSVPTSFITGFNFTSSAASGSVLTGMHIYTTILSGSDANPVDNLVVSDCKIDAGVCLFYGNNILIENCIFASNYPTGQGIQIPSYSTGNIIQNNYIHGYVALRPGTNTIIRNNIFASGDGNTVAFTDLQRGEPFGAGVKILNNIFFKTNPVGPNAVSDACEFKNNIYHLTGNDVPVNAQSSGNINADPLFVNYPIAGAGFSFEYDFRLQPSSPAINFGTDGKDIGMWGGPSPVNLGFEPPIPRIYDFKVNNATVPAGGTLQLTIKATRAQ
jgi:hypothetical protein